MEASVKARARVLGTVRLVIDHWEPHAMQCPVDETVLADLGLGLANLDFGIGGELGLGESSGLGLGMGLGLDRGGHEE